MTSPLPFSTVIKPASLHHSNTPKNTAVSFANSCSNAGVQSQSINAVAGSSNGGSGAYDGPSMAPSAASTLYMYSSLSPPMIESGGYHASHGSYGLHHQQQQSQQAGSNMYSVSIGNAGGSGLSFLDTNTSFFTNHGHTGGHFIHQNGLVKNHLHNSHFPDEQNKAQKADRSVSAFLPMEEIILNDQIASKNETVAKIYSEISSHDSDIIKVMSFHPNFLQEFYKFYNYLMYSQGALSFETRHYLAIMAAARHKCIYLVDQQEREFVLQNGTRDWLRGLSAIPQKLRDLYELNKLLCHQPWLINHAHIEKILRGQYSWSVTELVMAITILTHFHALSGFAFGCGINENYMQNLYMQQQQAEEKAAAEAAAAAAAAAVKLSEQEQESSDDEDDEYDDEEEDDDEDNGNGDFMDGGACGGDPMDGGESNTPYFRGRNSSRAVGMNGAGGRKGAGEGQYRTRSDSTGTSNRTLSNSSASSCELGIDMLLKEMQMIQADDKNNQGQTRSYQFRQTNAVGSEAAKSLSSSTHSLSATGKPFAASVNASSSAVIIPGSLSSQSHHTLHAGASAGLMASPVTSPSGASAMPASSVNSSSGTNTISNSPISAASGNYLTDLSNCGKNGHVLNHHHHNGHVYGHSTHLSKAANDLDAEQHNSHVNVASHWSNRHIVGGGNSNKKHAFGQCNDENEHDNRAAAATADDDLTTIDDCHLAGVKQQHNDSNNNNIKASNAINISRSRPHGSSLSSSYNSKQQQQQPVIASGPNATMAAVLDKVNKRILAFSDNVDYSHLNFKNADQALRLEYYTWENQGYVTGNSLYPEICELLDQTFNVAANMTYNTLGSHKQVDTSLFRRAVWMYIHSLFGIRYDDYDYNQIKQLTDRSLRSYIKTICSSPERITKKDYDSIMKEFTHSEKVHVNIVIMEARIQASMLYFLRAINSYFTN